MQSTNIKNEWRHTIQKLLLKLIRHTRADFFVSCILTRSSPGSHRGLARIPMWEGLGLPILIPWLSISNGRLTAWPSSLYPICCFMEMMGLWRPRPCRDACCHPSVSSFSSYTHDQGNDCAYKVYTTGKILNLQGNTSMVIFN
jgi:hypothetical protein